MQIAIALYPQFTALDALGPYQVLANLPESEVVFVAEKAGLISDDSAMKVEATTTFTDITHPDVVVVPGGMAAFRLAASENPLVEWIRAVHPTTTWTTSVCTGSLILGAAGVLQGRQATTHWFALDHLARYGATPSRSRYIVDDRVVTAAGVSAGIDMALHLTGLIAGDTQAQRTQLGMEYAPEPPYDAGRPDSAPAELTEQLTEVYDAALSRVMSQP